MSAVAKPAAVAPKPKPSAAKPKTAAAGASHPPYFEMIKEAIAALKDRTGSSSVAIAKYIEEKHGKSLPANFKKTLSVQLRGSAAKGKLVKVKASYKLSDAAKKDTKPAAAKAAAKPAKDASKAKKPKKDAAKKPKKAAAGAKRKAPEKKLTGKAKKSPAAKAKAKPKTVKSPAAKKARKVAAA